MAYLDAKPPLSILCFGAGAIGTYICGSLAYHGHRVVFLEVPQVADELRRRGLTLEINGNILRVPQPEILTQAGQALEGYRFDLAVFAIKSFDTRRTLEEIRDLKSMLPPFLCLQNGVENEAAIASLLGPERVIPATVTSAIGRRAAGDIVLERLRGVGIAIGNPLAEKLVEDFKHAGLNAKLFTSAASMKWSKLVTNLPANAASAILNLTPADIFANPGLFRLEIQQLREALSVMRAQKIQVTDLPGTPVRLFAWAVRYLPQVLSHPFLKKAIGGGRGGKMPSFHIDLYSKRGKSEVGYLNGAVADYGERLSLPTPANRFLTDTLLALTQNKIPLDAYAHNPDKFLADFSRYRSTALTIPRKL